MYVRPKTWVFGVFDDVRYPQQQAAVAATLSYYTCNSRVVGASVETA